MSVIMYSGVQVGRGRLASALSAMSAASTATTSSASLTSPVPGSRAAGTVASAARLQSLEAVVVVHVPGGGDLEAGTGQGQWALGDHCPTLVDGQQPVAPHRLEEGPHLCKGAVHLRSHEGNIV